MLSTVSERKMLNVRGHLLVAWLVLIVSLFWDPYSAALTEANNVDSPFRVTNEVIPVQKDDLISSPYPLGARIFWTMLVPIVPLFLMVFGHEAWRRICPLSFASQIPGYLGLQRSRSNLTRRTGKITRTILKIDHNGWLARNKWYVQFGLLFTGVTARIVIINSDRQAMGMALLLVIGAAMLSGLLWAGKAWCNYFCPVNVVQRIYTEPGGILESTPHISRPAIPQSMCRQSSPKGDVSACVACTANCGDIDLQRSYWNGVLDPQRRNVYYMFFGLILGFYGYYYIYSGSWEYYFSGIWTHEDGIGQKIFDPGLFFGGQSIPIPKIVAVPLTLGLFCIGSLGLGVALEALYRRVRSGAAGMSEKLIRHQSLSIAAWASINAFYLFGGRPNILLLPPLGQRLVDIAVVALTTIWLRQALRQTPTRFQQESMASGLTTQLRNLNVDISKYLEGRKIEHLNPSEIYLLTKVLPGFSQEKKLIAYRNILEETLHPNIPVSSTSLKLLHDFRIQLEIGEDEHNKLLDELGLPRIANPGALATAEKEEIASLDHFHDTLRNTAVSRLQAGLPVKGMFDDADFQATVGALQKSLRISDEEVQANINKLLSPSGIVFAKMREALDALVRQQSVCLCVTAVGISDPLGNTLRELLLNSLDAQEHMTCVKALSILRNFEPDAEIRRYAEELASLAGDELSLLLRQTVPSNPAKRWREVLHPEIRAILLGKVTKKDSRTEPPAEGRTHLRSVLSNLDVQTNLTELMSYTDPFTRAIGLAVFAFAEPAAARKAAERIRAEISATDHPLLVAVVEQLCGERAFADRQIRGANLRATIQLAGQPKQTMYAAKNYIKIGQALDNDVTIADPAVGTYHVAIKATHGAARLIRLDQGSVFVNGQQVHEESIALENGSVIHLGRPHQNAPSITIDWDGQAPADNAANVVSIFQSPPHARDNAGEAAWVEGSANLAEQSERERTGALSVHPVLRLAMLAHNDNLSLLPLRRLADIAYQSQVERYVRTARFAAHFGEEQYILIYQGQIRLFDLRKKDLRASPVFGPGDLIDTERHGAESSVLPEVASDFAIVLRIPPMPEIDAVAAAPQFGNVMLPESVFRIGV